MRDNSERELDMLEAIERIERYSQKDPMFLKVMNLYRLGLCIVFRQ